ncbi:MAG: sigma-54-dependent Fis family transcriptional regulator [Bacteroidales bacterium]|nr:sigma-54-dependent Fis family transcriptional regulator [Bacteroidales bacterium]
MSNTLKIFIVEDDRFYGQLLRHHLSLNPDNEVVWLQNCKECLDRLYEKPDVISLDYMLPDMSGKECFDKIKSEYPEIPVVIVSGQQDIKTAVDMLKAGAYDYFVKETDTKDRLWNAVNNIRKQKKLSVELDSLKQEVQKKYSFRNIIKGNSDSIKKIFDLMEKAVKTNITVSLTGETGTGKELAAKAIHYNSPRSKKPFIAINVSAIPETLIESEMFGYEKGAFTGANSRKMGKFELASGGTLFLDEVADMDKNMQVKLLRVLQEKEFTRVGGLEEVSVDTRLIVATNKDLAEEVNAGRFRQDLYYRLLGLPIQLPPLRERDNDVLLLATHFIEEFCRENNIPVKDLTPEARNKLQNYHFPGNVRELRSVIELSVVLAEEQSIDERHIHFNSGNPMAGLLNQDCTLAEYESKIIKYYLEKYNGNVVEAAKKLGVGKSTIYRMLKKEKEEKS